jgi:hypothetical protein
MDYLVAPGRCCINFTTMTRKQSEYFAREDRQMLLTQEPVRFTYSFNNVERTVIGQVQERDNQIYLYEYRDKYIGTEFFISFSKESVSYKLIKVDGAVLQTSLL